MSLTSDHTTKIKVSTSFTESNTWKMITKEKNFVVLIRMQLKPSWLK